MLIPLLLAAVTLSPGATTRGSLAGGETTVYRFDVPAESAARLVVKQEGIDVWVTLRLAGSDLPKYGLDMVAGTTGQELVFPAVLPAPQSWDLHIKPALPRAARGDFSIELEIVPATDRDRAVAAARAQYQLASDTSWGGDGASFRAALPLYFASAEAAAAAGDRVLAAEATFQAGRQQDSLGDAPASLETQKRALALFREIGHRDRESRVLNRLGLMSYKIGEVGDSEAYYTQAAPVAAETGDKQSIADIMNNHALLLSSIGRLEEAIDRFESAIPLAQEINSSNIETALQNNIADCYRRLGMLDRAVASYERGLELSRKNLPLRRVAKSLLNLSLVWFEVGDRLKAEDYLRQSLEAYEKTDDKQGTAEALGLQGRMLHASGETERALETFARSVPLLAEVKSRGSEASVLTSWAEVEVERGLTDAALPRLDRALELSQMIANRSSQAEVWYVRARALQRKDDIEGAIDAIGEAVELVEAMRGEIVRSELRSSYLTTVRRYFDLQVELLQQNGQVAAAFTASERSRARTLLESLAYSAAKIRKGVPADLLARERLLRAKVNAKEVYRGQLVIKEGDKSPRAIALAQEVSRLLEEWKDAEANVRAASPAFAALRSPEPVTVPGVRAMLDSDTALVEYHLGRKQSWAWVIDRKSITVHKLAGSTVIELLARKYHEALSTAGDASQLAAQLAKLVWKPVASRASAKRLLIVADGALQYVPFAALPDGGEPLLVRAEIVYLPSASVLRTIRSDRRKPEAIAAVFADPVFSAKDVRLKGTASEVTGPYQRLRFSRTEAEAVIAAAPGSFEAIDFDAAKKTLLERDLRRYRILHFATHGSLNTQQPELSGLVLSLVDREGNAIDGYLRLHEIYNLDLDADLVVLSACQTALGKEVWGEGLIGLTRGFMYAGASRVVATTWNVDDRSSALLMKNFYASMLENRSPAAALREAQLALYRQARWRNPHYWAGFGIQGEYR